MQLNCHIRHLSALVRRPRGISSLQLSDESEIPKCQPKHTAYSAEETRTMFDCYVDASEFPVIANSQNSNTFWEKIANRYCDVHPEGTIEHTTRTHRAYFKRVSPKITKFCVFYYHLGSQWKCGWSEADLLNEAQIMYQ